MAQQQVGHGTACSDTITSPLGDITQTLTIHHPLAYSDIRNLSSIKLWHLHERLRTLIQKRYSACFAVADGLNDAALIATHDSWVVVDMLLHQRQLGARPEVVPTSSSGTSSPPSSQSWEEITMRDFAFDALYGLPASGGLRLEDVYDLTDYTERKTAHLYGLTGQCRSSGKRSVSSTESKSRFPRKPQATDDSGNCLLGCTNRRCHITDCTASERPADTQDEIYMMSGALPPDAPAISIEDPMAAFCVRDKQLRPSIFTQRSKSAAEAPWTQASALETGMIEDQRGRARLRDIGRRLSSMSIACRNFWSHAKVPTDEDLPRVELYVQRNAATEQLQVRTPRRSSLFWRSKSLDSSLDLESGDAKDERGDVARDNDWAFLNYS